MDLEKSASKSVVKGGFSGQCCVIKDSLSTNLALFVNMKKLVSHQCTRYRRALLSLACMTEYFCVTFVFNEKNAMSKVRWTDISSIRIAVVGSLC